MKKLLLAAILTLLFLPAPARAVTAKNVYPRLANYFLRWEITDREAVELAKWDLLILDMEVQENSRRELLKIRELNPNVIILAYLTSQEIIDQTGLYNNAYLRQELASGLSDGWWLTDANGNKISNWPYTSMLNLTEGALSDNNGQRFNDYLPEFVADRLQATDLWDGVFYDNTWGDIAWINGGDLDLDNDGRAESQTEADRLWASGFRKMLSRTRELTGPDFIIIGNGRVYDPYLDLLNGMMLEGFPSSWENGGSWTGSMETYFKLPILSSTPSLPVINIYDKDRLDYRHVRFGLTSTLMGQGYFSYDYDVTDHGQTWWYDEYAVNLGPSQTSAYNLLNAADTVLMPGLWRRDFRSGVAIVNSTDKKQTYVFDKEELEKIKGTQDPEINNGQRINYISLEPQDGLVLLKTNAEIYNSPFTNGYFYRVFNEQGSQVRAGFFAYSAAYPGEAAVALASGSRDNETAVTLSANRGWVTLYRDGKAIASFPPYTRAYDKELNMAAEIEDGYFKQVVVGTGPGGGPQVGIFSAAGQLASRWFAYDKNERGGVQVALGDVDGDGRLEVITGPGLGAVPEVKVFSLQGELIRRIPTYGPKFRGGVSVAAGDLDGDGRAEIVTAPASGGGPHIMIFDGEGRRRASWFAYEKEYRGGFKLSLSDLDGDGRSEIFVGIKNF